MMVTRAEAARATQAVESEVAHIKSAALGRRDIHEILANAKQLEPNERRLVVIELATTLWLRSLTQTGLLYPGFEAFLRACFSGKSNAEQHVRSLIGTGRMHDDAEEIYGDYLRSMFEASGKTRGQFYADMVAEMGAQESIDTADFGERAVTFFRKVIGTLHEEHLLVFYCAKLFSKLYKARDHNNSAPMTDEKLEMAYKYFESVVPMREDFLYYTKDDVFLSYSLEQGDLSEIK